MKLRMAPNSLFAVLLRSPWWISIVVAMLITLVSLALLPEAARGAGALAGVPFLVLGIVALWRQRGVPSARKSQAILEAVRRMGWPEFSSALERGFARDGFTVRRVQGVADLLLQHGSQRTLVSARRWKAARLGEDSLQALQAAAIAHEAGSSLCIFLGEVSPQARQFAQRNGIRLLQEDGLVQLLAGVLPASP